jgi:signal transduction histidine kinase
MDEAKGAGAQQARSSINGHMAGRQKRRQQSIVFPGWVVLGLIAVSVGISLLELAASVFGKLSLAPLPGLQSIVLYLILMFVQPRLFPWPRRRIIYLVGIFAVILVVELVSPPPVRFIGYITVYGVAAHAHVAFGKKGAWLVEALIAVAIFLGMLLTGGVALEDHFRRQLTEVGIRPGAAALPLQFGIWLLGLIFVHAFTALGIQERSARLRSDELVQELTTTQEQLRAYALRAEDLATVRERSRVAREVHDTLAQGLAAIKMHLETGSAVFHEQPDLAYQHMERARELAGEHLRQTRNSILELRSDALGGQILPSALAALVSVWRPWHTDGSDASGSRATFCVSGMEKDAGFWHTLSPTVELACYRVAQEALSNATKHGQARHVDVELSVEAEELCLTITDDGIGFDLAAISPREESGGFGIIGMHERMKLLNGRLEVISAPGAGTQVVAMIPLGMTISSVELAPGKQ